MSDELKQVELEIARTKLAQAKLELRQAEQKHERVERVVDAGQRAIETVHKVAKPPKGAFNWMVWVPAVPGLFLLMAGGPADKGVGLFLLGLAAAVYVVRAWRGRSR